MGNENSSSSTPKINPELPSPISHVPPSVLETNTSNNSKIPSKSNLPSNSASNNDQKLNKMQNKQGTTIPPASNANLNKKNSNQDQINSQTLAADIDKLTINKKREVNVLLLGETGVGKSTFINALMNYLQFEEFENAEKHPFYVLIPSSFVIEDKSGKMQKVNVGAKSDNEDLTTGNSATQAVKTYSFCIKDGQTLVRLIDTPGMGDTRGIEQDNINCENILDYINGLHELHAICYLLKPQQSRSTAYFKYCTTQILARLEKSACKNIIFVLTHAKGSNYSAGDTYPLLQAVVDEIKQNPAQAEIALNENMFCFDNEAFRTLAAFKNQVELSEDVKIGSRESWKRSVTQCWKMIKFIAQLPPHLVHHTAAINEARRVIHQLAKPMADIAQLINDNIEILKRHKNSLDNEKSSLSDLRSKLYIPVIDLEVTKLTQPVTVCTDIKCIDTLKVGEEGRQENHYKTKCHDPCYLKNVPRNLLGSPELMNCACMGSDRQNCKLCTHSYLVHMHVYYFTTKKERQRTDPNISKSINTKELIIEEAKKIIVEIEQRKSKLESELKIIVTSNAKFAHFLKKNAIATYTDAYSEYIEYLIRRERCLGDDCDLSKLSGFQRLLREHNELKKVFAEAAEMQKKIGLTDSVTPQDISTTMNKLFALELNGKKIKEMYDSQKKVLGREYSHTEYVHKGVFKPKELMDKPAKVEQQKKSDNKSNSGSNSNNNSNNRNTQQQSRPHNNNNNNNQGRGSSQHNNKNNHQGRGNFHNNNQRSKNNNGNQGNPQKPQRSRTPPPRYSDTDRHGASNYRSPPTSNRYPPPPHHPPHASGVGSSVPPPPPLMQNLPPYSSGPAPPYGGGPPPNYRPGYPGPAYPERYPSPHPDNYHPSKPSSSDHQKPPEVHVTVNLPETASPGHPRDQPPHQAPQGAYGPQSGQYHDYPRDYNNYPDPRYAAGPHHHHPYSHYGDARGYPPVPPYGDARGPIPQPSYPGYPPPPPRTDYYAYGSHPAPPPPPPPPNYERRYSQDHDNRSNNESYGNRSNENRSRDNNYGNRNRTSSTGHADQNRGKANKGRGGISRKNRKRNNNNNKNSGSHSGDESDTSAYSGKNN